MRARILGCVAVASALFVVGCTSVDNCPANVESFTTYADDDGGVPGCRDSCPGGHRALLGCQILAIDMAVRYEHVLCSFGPCSSGGGGVMH